MLLVCTRAWALGTRCSRIRPTDPAASLAALGPGRAGNRWRVICGLKFGRLLVCGFAPPGDIHRVWNAGTGRAISLHVYGADISRLGTSVRRVYELPADR